MKKQELLKRSIEIRSLIRKLEDLSKDLSIGDISQDKIYIALKSHLSTIEIMIHDFEEEQS